MQINLSSCALCGKESELQLSHIIPKFVYRRFIKTAVGKLRSGLNPNVPVQDGEKHYMLCKECEELFSSYETQFASKIFIPYQDASQKRFVYDSWLQYFMISVSWRSLYLDLIDFVQHETGSVQSITSLVECEHIMRDFLLGKRFDTGIIENQIFFFDDVYRGSAELIKLNPHLNIRRGATSYTVIVDSNQAHYTFTNMMGILLFTLYGRREEETWTNTQVYDSGIIEAKQQVIRSHCADEILRVLEEVEKIRSSISEKQQEKINERYRMIEGKETDYPIFELFEKDKQIKEQDH